MHPYNFKIFKLAGFYSHIYICRGNVFKYHITAFSRPTSQPQVCESNNNLMQNIRLQQIASLTSENAFPLCDIKYQNNRRKKEQYIYISQGLKP